MCNLGCKWNLATGAFLISWCLDCARFHRAVLTTSPWHSHHQGFLLHQSFIQRHVCWSHLVKWTGDLLRNSQELRQENRWKKVLIESKIVTNGLTSCLGIYHVTNSRHYCPRSLSFIWTTRGRSIGPHYESFYASSSHSTHSLVSSQVQQSMSFPLPLLCTFLTFSF